MLFSFVDNTILTLLSRNLVVLEFTKIPLLKSVVNCHLDDLALKFSIDVKVCLEKRLSRMY